MDNFKKTLKIGVTFYLITIVFLTLSIISGVLSLVSSSISLTNLSLLGFLVFGILSFVFDIIALIELWKGFSLYEDKSNLTILGKIGLILSVFIIIPTLFIIGEIFVGITFYDIGKVENNSLIQLGGILAAIPIPFISIIGLIILILSL